MKRNTLGAAAAMPLLALSLACTAAPATPVAPSSGGLNGALGPENNLTGDTLVAYLREKHPDFKPQRIVDMGCAIGNSTVVWGRAFPKAELHGIDVGAPVLRYAHARAESPGHAA